MTDPVDLPVIEQPDLPPGHELWEDHGFIVALDLGQRVDFSAVCVLQRFVRNAYVRHGTEVDAASFEVAERREHYTREELGVRESRVCAFQLRDLHRWPLGTEYPRIVTETLRTLLRSELAGRPAVGRSPARPEPSLVVDAGGATGVVDLFKERWLTRLGHASGSGPRLVPVAITSGMRIAWVEGRQHVPKAALVSAVDVLLSTSRLWVADGLALWPVLAKELQDFRVKRTESTGYESFAAREGQHDDLVLSLAIGVWWGQRLDRAARCEMVIVKPGSLSL